jgi:hypothetical protein
VSWHYRLKFRLIVVPDVFERITVRDIQVRDLRYVDYVHQAVTVDLVIVLVIQDILRIGREDMMQVRIVRREKVILH